MDLAAAGYGPVNYWFNMPLGELVEWLKVIDEKQKSAKNGA